MSSTIKDKMELPSWIEDTPQNREYIKRIKGLNYIKDVDGFYYLSLYNTQGLMGSNDLKTIAWYLEQLNKPYEKELEEYFKKERSTGDA